MKSCWKKSLSMLMALAMAVSLCILPAGAEEVQEVSLAAEVTVSGITTQHETLQEAIGSVANNVEADIQLLADVTTDQEIEIGEAQCITLDLDGHKIESTLVCTENNYTISNYGDLTINDTGDNGIVYNSSKVLGVGEYGHDTIRNFANLTINGGTFGDQDLNRDNVNDTNYGAAVRNVAGTCTINGGYFTCVDNYGTWENGNTSYSYAIRNGGTMTINGGTVYGAMNGGIAADAGTVTIEDVSVSVTGAKSFACLSSNKRGGGTFIVKGGTYTKTGNDNPILNSFAGMPSWDATEDLIENGYTITGGTYTVKGETQILVPVAEVGGKQYGTLGAAVAAANDGDTIKVLSDATLDSAITPKKNLIFEGAVKADGSMPVIKAAGKNGLFSLAGDYSLTLRGLNLQTAQDENWTIYHSAGDLTVDKCEFSMAKDVAYAGNLIMGEGGANKKLVLTDNSVSVRSRAAFVGLGNDSVVTGNTIDLLADRIPSGSRTSVISLTTDATANSITITGNTFKNANRVLAVDNAEAMPASKLLFTGNRFINVRYAFELGSSANAACGTYDISKNYYINGEAVSAPLVEDANAENSSHFDDSSLYKGSQVKTSPYYVRDAIGDSTALSDYSPYVPDPDPVTPEPQTETTTTTEGDVTTETTTTTTTNEDGSKTTEKTETVTNAVTGEKTEEKVTATVDTKTGTSTTATVKTNADGKSSAELVIENTKDAKSVSVPAAAIKSAAKADEVSMTVKTSVAAITLDAGAVAAIAAAEGETVSLAVERVKPEALPEAAREILKDAVVVDLSITVGESKVESFNGGRATVAVPYKKADADKGVAVYFVDEAGVIKRVPGAKYNEETGSVTFATEHFSYYAVKEETVPPYTDVAETAWYYDAVQYVHEQKLFYGTSAVTFDPMLDMSREMLATVLYRKAGSPDTAGMALDEFTDSGKISDWAKDAMTWAVSEGIIVGKDSSTLAPRDSVTRQEIVTILHRVAGKPVVPGDGLDGFTDSPSVAPWARSAMEWAVAKGILAGKGDGVLAPLDTTVRCEVAAFIMRSK